MVTSNRSTGEKWRHRTSYAAGFLVSPSPSLASEKEQKMTDGSGPSFDGAFGSYDPDSSSLRTFQVSLLMGERESLETLPPAGTMRNGRLFQRQPLVPRTSGSESFSSDNSEGHQAPFPTPSSTEYGSSGNAGGNNTVSANRSSLSQMARKWLWPTPRSSDGEKGGPNQRGSKGDLMLPSAVHRWPTPNATDHKGVSKKGQRRGQLLEAVMWATPKSSPSGPDYARAGREGSGGDDLATQVARETWPTPRVCAGDKSSGMNRAEFYRKMGHEKSNTTKGGKTKSHPGGQLNPTWVEWLMGFPLGWTDLGL